jgi:hypothetical protein
VKFKKDFKNKWEKIPWGLIILGVVILAFIVFVMAPTVVP